MIAPRWKKIIREIWGDKKRSFLVILSIALGVMAVGLSVSARQILSRELPKGYASSNPAGATFQTSEIDDDFIDSVRRMKGVLHADGQRILMARARVSAPREIENWRNLILFGIPDFADQQVNIAEHVQGPLTPGKMELLLDQAAVGLANARLGDKLLVQTPDGRRYKLQFSGIVHDQSQQPATFEGNIYGFVTLDTLEMLGEPRGYNRLHIIAGPEGLERAEVRAVAERVRKKIEDSGQIVYSSNVPEPGKHPLQDTVDGLLLLLAAFGVLSLILSGFLTLNTLSALLGQQVRQVGIMKAIGARTGQLTTMYLGMAFIYGLAGVLIGAPLGMLGARWLALFVAGIINADVNNLYASPTVLLLEGAVGISAALLAAIVPVWKGTRLTIRQALSNDLMDQGKLHLWKFDPASRRRGAPPLQVSLALRNSLRSRGRLALTLITLTLGSAFFVAVMSTYSSTYTSVEEIFRYWQYDLMVNFEKPYRVEEITQAALRTSGVVAVDPGVMTLTNRIYADDSQSDALFLYAIPADTFSLKPKILAGRWLLPQDENAVVVSNIFLDEEPDVQVGDMLRLKLEGKELDWRVVGVVHMMYADGPTVYVNQPYYASATSANGKASQLYVLTSRHDDQAQHAAMQEMDKIFKQQGLHVTYTIPMTTLRNSIREIFNAVVVVLMVMAVLLSTVGSVGLTGIMELNVLERTREIGVMRALGATDRRLMAIILAEGMAIGAVSWLAGCLLAFPLSKWLTHAVGLAVVQNPFTYTYSVQGAALWLALDLALSALSCSLPAQRACQITVREAIAYE